MDGGHVCVMHTNRILRWRQGLFNFKWIVWKTIWDKCIFRRRQLVFWEAVMKLAATEVLLVS